MKRSRWETEDSELPQEPKKHIIKPITDAKVAQVTQKSLTNRSTISLIQQDSNVFTNYILPCRIVEECYETLNKIEEGTYGVVYRARDRTTKDIVALKHLKIDNNSFGFSITSLREIFTLKNAKHPNLVNIREIAAGSSLNSVYIVMDFIEHDLKALITTMPSAFLQSEVKTIMLQLLSAVGFLHENWIIHRDLKTSNLLMNNSGQIKVADFGLARKYSSPIRPMTNMVVTLWYRSPELLFGEKKYTTAVDIWSVGCIFAELIDKEPLFPGTSEIGQISKIFSLLGTPDEVSWPQFQSLPNSKLFSFNKQSRSKLREKFTNLTQNGIDLLSRLLDLNPETRISADDALNHPYFRESPHPKDPSLFPTWPSKSSGEVRKVYHSPSAPKQPDNKFVDDINYTTPSTSIFNTNSAQPDTSSFKLKI